MTPENNVWLYTSLLLERNIQNLLVPYEPMVLVFLPNMYSGPTGQWRFIYDIIRMCLCIVLFIFTLYRLRSLNWTISYILLDAGALNILIALLVTAAFTISILQSSE